MERVFYKLMGIRLPSLPVTSLYSHVSILLTFFDFNLAIITDLMLWILKTFDLTMSNSCAATSVCSSFSLAIFTPVCSGFCIPTWAESLSHTLNSSCHRLDTFLAHVYSHSICNYWFFSFLSMVLFFCSMLLWDQILYCLWLPLLLNLLGPLHLDSSHPG